MKDSDHRKAAVVQKGFFGREDHDILTCMLSLSMDGGSTGQGFGGLCLGEDDGSGALFKKKICALFRVRDLAEIEGRSCFALYSFPREQIEGLEVDGKRFTVAGFRKLLQPQKNFDALAEKRQRLLSDIDRDARAIRDRREQLERLSRDYVDWGYGD